MLATKNNQIINTKRQSIIENASCLYDIETKTIHLLGSFTDIKNTFDKWCAIDTDSYIVKDLRIIVFNEYSMSLEEQTDLMNDLIERTGAVDRIEKLITK